MILIEDWQKPKNTISKRSLHAHNRKREMPPHIYSEEAMRFDPRGTLDDRLMLNIIADVRYTGTKDNKRILTPHEVSKHGFIII